MARSNLSKFIDNEASEEPEHHFQLEAASATFVTAGGKIQLEESKTDLKKELLKRTKALPNKKEGWRFIKKDLQMSEQLDRQIKKSCYAFSLNKWPKRL